MISKLLERALNEQHNFEFASGYLYLSMSAWFTEQGLPGFAHWMRIQTREELVHGTRFFDYLNERGGRVELQAIVAPKKSWNSVLEAFEDAYEHELEVTRRVCALADLALTEKDHMTGSFLKVFIDEQVEEEASALAIVQKLRWVKDAPYALYQIDQELAGRVFNPALVSKLDGGVL